MGFWGFGVIKNIYISGISDLDDKASLHFLAVRANVQFFGIFICIWKDFLPSKGGVVKVVAVINLLLQLLV